MQFDLARYFEDFNRNDDAATVDRYYRPDVVVEGPDRAFHGREEWLRMLSFVHAGVKEELRPLLTVREGDKLMAELEAVFTPLIDRDDFPFGPLKAGVALTMRFFASYRLHGAQIARLHLAFWPPKDEGLRD
jgi:hypothetical protein